MHTKPENKSWTYIVLGISLLFYLLNGWISFQYPVWMDEAVTLKYYIDYANPFDIFTDLYYGVDVYPPLYYFIASILYKLTGKTVIALTLFNKVLLLAAVFILFRKIRHHFSLFHISLMALLLSATSSFMFLKNFEIRTYGLFFFLLSWSFVNFLSYKERKKRSSLVFFTIANTLMLYTHYYGAFLLFIWFLLDIVVGWKAKNFGLAVSMVLSVAIFSPWIPAVINQYQNVGGYFYHEIPGLYDLFKLPFSFLGSYQASVLFLILVFFIYFTARRKIPLHTLMEENRYYLQFILVTLLLVLSGFVLSRFKFSVYYPRYFISIVLSIIVFSLICLKYIGRLNKGIIYGFAILLLFSSALETRSFYKQKDLFWQWINYYKQYESGSIPFVCEESRHYFILDYYADTPNYFLLLDKKYLASFENNSNDYFAYYWSKGMKEKYQIPTIRYYEDFIQEYDSFYFMKFRHSYLDQYYFSDSNRFEKEQIHGLLYFIRKK